MVKIKITGTEAQSDEGVCIKLHKVLEGDVLKEDPFSISLKAVEENVAARTTTKNESFSTFLGGNT